MPPGTAVFQLSADVRDLGRTYATALSTVGDIRASLDALLPLLAPRLTDKARDFAKLREVAVAEQAERRRKLHAAADAAFEDPVIDPLVAAREVAKAWGRRPRSSTRRPPRSRACAPSSTAPRPTNTGDARRRARLGDARRSGVLAGDRPGTGGLRGGRRRGALLAAGPLDRRPREAARHLVVINNAEYNILKNYMKGQSHYASARANRFIAMDLTDPRIDFLALAASMASPPGGSRRPPISPRRSRRGSPPVGRIWWRWW